MSIVRKVPLFKGFEVNYRKNRSFERRFQGDLKALSWRLPDLPLAQYLRR